MAREAMDLCLRLQKESIKSKFDSYSVRNSVLIISHITFWDCRMHIFSHNLFRKSCILHSLQTLLSFASFNIIAFCTALDDKISPTVLRSFLIYGSTFSNTVIASAMVGLCPGSCLTHLVTRSLRTCSAIMEICS